MSMARERKALAEGEAKALLSDALQAFAEFCDAKGLRYFLGGGTLLGAVRHRGFIPWDDDVDVLMPRPDYDAFLRLTEGAPIRQNLAVQSPGRGKGYLWPFAKVVNTDTVLVELQYKRRFARMQRERYGLYIDIFPVDGIPASPGERRRFFGKIRRYTKGLQRSTYHLKGVRPFARLVFRLLVHPVYALIGYRWFLRRLTALATGYEYEKQDFVAACFGSYGVREAMEKSVFSGAVKVSFEGREYSAPAGYRQYLASLYGDYMTPPPEGRRVTHHRRELYWAEGRGKARDLAGPGGGGRS